MPTFLLRERIGDFAVHPTYPEGMNVTVQPGVLISNTGTYITGIPDSNNYGSAQVLSSSQTVGPFVAPAAGTLRNDLIVISTDLTINVITGTPVAVPGPAVSPVFPSNVIPLAEISLTAATASIGSDEIQDVRSFLTPHQDRTRKIRIDTWEAAGVAPAAGTSGDFSTTIFNAGLGAGVKFSITIPEDFDYNRSMYLKFRGFTGAAGGAGNVQWDVDVTRVALGAGAGTFPPGVTATTNNVFAALDDLSYEVYSMQIAGSVGTKHFNLRTLLPGDLLAFVITRNAGDAYLGAVNIVEATIDYNVGYSVYPG